MKNGIYSATAGMLTAVERLNVISNNLANINTPGFKSDIPFEKVIRFLSEEPFPGKDQPILAGTALDKRNGNIKMTKRKLDLAFEGSGYFVVKMPDGKEYYTRNGAFDLNSKRELVTSDGLPVLDKFNKKIKMFGKEYYFTPKGDLFIDGNYYTTLKIVDIPDRNQLEKIGNHFFRLKDSTFKPKQIQDPNVVVGALEQSNVELMKEMTSLIITQRSFEFQQRALDTILTQILRRTVTDLPRPI